MKTPQKWLIVGIGVGVLGIVLILLGLVVALLGLVLPGIVLVVVGVLLLAILGVGYPSPKAVKEGKRTLYQEDEADPFGEPVQPEDPNDRFVSAVSHVRPTRTTRLTAARIERARTANGGGQRRTPAADRRTPRRAARTGPAGDG